jgi:hypothetical protein
VQDNDIYGGTYGIQLDGGSDVNILGNNVIASGFIGTLPITAEDGILVFSTSAQVTGLNISNNIVSRSGRHGINLNTQIGDAIITGNTIKNSSQQDITHVSQSGLQITAGINPKIIGNNIIDDQPNLITTLTTNASSGQANIVVANPLLFWVGQYISIADGTPQNENAIISSMNLATKTITLSGNLANTYTTAQSANITGRATQVYGIRFSGTAATTAIISGNTLRGNRVGTITGIPSDAIVNGNSGYKTENSGASLGTAAQQTIAHGLSFTPTKQQIGIFSDNSTGTAYQSASPDATNIYVTEISGSAWHWATIGN